MDGFRVYQELPRDGIGVHESYQSRTMSEWSPWRQ